jgi:hypothetical protein
VQRPRKPQRKPKPSAALVSISNEKLASFKRSFEMLSRNFSKSFASVGNSPQNTTGCTSLKPGSASAAGLGVGDRVAHARLGDLLDLRGDEADLARPQFGQLLDLGPEAADAIHQMARAPRHEGDLLPLLQHARHHAHEDDDAQIRIIPAVDEHRLQRRVGSPFGAGIRSTIASRISSMPMPDLAEARMALRRVQPDDVLDLLADLFGLGGGQIDLVDDRHDLMIMLDRLIDVGERLRFHALRRIHHQQGALARGQAARDLIGEVDMPRRVHQVEDMALPVEAHGLRLDGDAALLLDIHIVEHLGAHLTVGQAAGALDQAIGKRGLAMIDMGDDREIADLVERGHGGRLAGSAVEPKSRRQQILVTTR